MRALSLLLIVACDPPDTQGPPDPATRPVQPPPVPQPVTGVSITAVAYNVESGDAQVGFISDKIDGVTGEVLWGFAETESQSWLTSFAVAADDGGQDFQTILGTTGFNDRLGIVYDASALRLITQEELQDINVGGTARAPLVAEFEVIENGGHFLFMVNHLWRTNDAARLQQAGLLNTWVREQALPVVAMGDYNFDWAVADGENDHDPGYDELVSGGAWEWVRPDPLIPTQCSRSFAAVLDFAFVGGAAQGWPRRSEILFPQNVNCQDDAFKPDHRPVSLTITIANP